MLHCKYVRAQMGYIFSSVINYIYEYDIGTLHTYYLHLKTLRIRLAATPPFANVTHSSPSRGHATSLSVLPAGFETGSPGSPSSSLNNTHTNINSMQTTLHWYTSDTYIDIM